jgi:sugar lactone lactonase YvrE
MKALLISIGATLLVSSSHADSFQPGDVLISRVPGILAVHVQTGATSYVTKDGMLQDRLTDLIVTKTGRILCASWSSPGGGLGDIVEVDPSTGAQTVFATGGYLVRPGALALSATGALLVLDFGATIGDGRLVRIDLASGQQTLLHSGDGPSYVADLAELPDGDILVGEKNGVDSGIYRWNHMTSQETKITGGYMEVTSIVVEPQGNIYVTWSPDAGSDTGFELDQLDLSTGSLHMITGLWEAFQMAQAPDGSLWIAAGLAFSANHFDPTTGAYLGDINCQPDIIRTLAVWPDVIVPTQSTTWGKLKAQYR